MGKKRTHGDGGLYYIPSRKLWRGTVELGYDETGKRIQRQVHARTQRDCRDKLETLKAEIHDHGAPLNRQTRLREWAERWLETVARVEVDPKTYSTYRSLTRNWIIPTIGRKIVATLKPSDVRDLHRAILDAGRSTSTARQTHVVLSMMLAAARADRLCSENVAEHVKRPTGKATVERGAIPTPDALRILRRAAEMPDSAGSRWWFKLIGGQRQGEILGATLADLDLDAGVYVVDWKLEEIARDHNCGGTCGRKRGANCPDAVWRIPRDFEHHHLQGRFHLTRPKSETTKVLPLIPQLATAIGRHLEATEDAPNPHGLIWRNPDGSPISARQDAQEWRALMESAGITDAAITGHWARHTVVTILASLGVDHQLIGEIVGHSSTQVTELYRHSQATERRAAMEALGGVWGEALELPAMP